MLERFGPTVQTGGQSSSQSRHPTRALLTGSEAGTDYVFADYLPDGLDLGVADFEPWLGDRIGFFAAGDDGEAAAVLFQATDVDRANREIERLVEAADPERAQYRGVPYVVVSGLAVGTVDGSIVAGSSAGFRAAVDVSLGSQSSLADSGGMEPLLGRFGSPVATLSFIPEAFRYVEPPSLETFLASARGNSPSQPTPLLTGGGVVGGRAAPSRDLHLITAGSTDEHEEVAEEVAESRLSLGLFLRRSRAVVEYVGGAVESSVRFPRLLLGRLPVEADLAFSLPDFGDSVFEAFAAANRGSVAWGDSLRRGLLRELGFDPVAAAASVGELAGFAWTSQFGQLQAALVASVFADVE